MFEQQTVRPLWKKWKNMDLWKLWEGIWLVLEMEPTANDIARKDRSSMNVYSHWQAFNEMAAMAERSITAGKLRAYKPYPNFLYCEFMPAVFRMGLTIPPVVLKKSPVKSATLG